MKRGGSPQNGPGIGVNRRHDGLEAPQPILDGLAEVGRTIHAERHAAVLPARDRDDPARRGTADLASAGRIERPRAYRDDLHRPGAVAPQQKEVTIGIEGEVAIAPIAVRCGPLHPAQIGDGLCPDNGEQFKSILRTNLTPAPK